MRYDILYTHTRERIFRTRTGLNACKSMSEEYLLEHVLGLKRDQRGLYNFPISTTRPSYLWLPQNLKGSLPLYKDMTYLPQKIISSCEFLIRSTKTFAVRIEMSVSIKQTYVILFFSTDLVRIRGECSEDDSISQTCKLDSPRTCELFQTFSLEFDWLPCRLCYSIFSRISVETDICIPRKFAFVEYKEDIT